MCKKLLVQEYRAWLGEILEIMEDICEDVVPAGRLDADIYWKTKALWEEAKQYEANSGEYALVEALLAYAQTGRALLEPIEAAVERAKSEGGHCAQGANTQEASNQAARIRKEAGIPEEERIQLRREYRHRIFNSLQMLANFSFLAKEYLQQSEEITHYFEVDAAEEVKRIRSGVMVESKKQEAEVKIYLCHGKKVGNWKAFVAG